MAIAADARTTAAAHALLALTARTLAGLGLELHPTKTQVTSFDEGFQFLGVYLQKEEIWRPWKEKAAPNGRVLHMAPPMPPWRLAEYRASPSASTALGEALKEAAVRSWNFPAVSQTHPEEDPGMAYLYLTEQGSVLRKSGDRLLVEHEERIVLDIPYHKLEHVLLFGHVQVTTQALGELLDKGVDLSLFSRQGAYRGSLTPPRSGNVLDRLAQYELWRDGPRALAWACAIVAAKIAGQQTVLGVWQRNAAGGTAELREVADEMQPLREAAASARTRDSLLGFEGQAAKLQYRALASVNRSGFVFTGRRRHPATDPFNALLSLAYTLLTHEMASLVEADGLDPCLGVLHEIDRSRPSLALDLVEAFRGPVADRLVLQLVNRDQIRSEHFQPAAENQAVFLTPNGLRHFLVLYDEWLRTPRSDGTSFRDGIRAEVRKVVAALRKKEVIVPWQTPEGLSE